MPDRYGSVDRPPVLATPRPPEDQPADERTMLMGWMSHLRASAARKIDGLDDDRLRWTPAPTANSAGGIVTHLAYCERWWFRVVFAAEDLPLDFKDDGMRMTFRTPDGWSAAKVRAFYEDECRLADAAIEGASLDEWSRTDLPRRATLRWIVTHMIEETARHAGHLDLTRELIDGETGR